MNHLNDYTNQDEALNKKPGAGAQRTARRRKNHIVFYAGYRVRL